MKIKLFAAVLLIGCLTSGAAFGHSITQTEVDQIRPGYTTGTDLVRIFGPPITWSTDVHQATSVQWFRAPGAGWQTYLPIIGSFLGGFDMEIQELSVELGADGRVRSFTMYDSKGRATRRTGVVDHSK